MSDAWCESKQISEADWRSGDALHPREIELWKQYFKEKISADDVANELTVTLQQEARRECPQWHPWSMLNDALMELPNKRSKVIEVLHAIKRLELASNGHGSGASSVQPSKLNDFANLWADCHRAQLWGPSDAEKSRRTLSPEQIRVISEESATAGLIEAELCKANIFPMAWGLQTLAHLLETEGVALEFYISGASEWLNRLAEQLWLEILRAGPSIWSGINPRVSGIKSEDPPEEHWRFWKQRLEYIDEQTSNQHVRSIASKCLDRMRKAESEGP